LNTKSRGLKLGLIFGYSELKPVIKIDEDFHSVEHLGANDKDVIIGAEAWGCGSPKAHASQKDIKKWESTQQEKMRTVKINAENWNENADKEILELGGITVNHSQRGDF
jgi:hypothetical protein